MNIGMGLIVFLISLIALVAEFILYFIFGFGASFSGNISTLEGVAFFFVGLMVLTGAIGLLYPLFAIIATKVSYIVKYQIIFIRIENNSKSILNVNPNYFTLVSNKKVSYSYSSETHAFKEELGFLAENPIQAVDVYPGTISEGFLLFEKKYEDERPQKIFFKNLNKHISTDVILDKGVKK